MIDDVVLNKMQIIERCLRRVQEEYGGTPDSLRNFTKQDSIILNIQRACEAAMDLAMHVVAEHRLGLPQSSRDAFELLCSNGLIDAELSRRLQAMVGFRNIAIHEYQNLDLLVLQTIIEKHLDDLNDFAKVLLRKRDGN